MAEPLADGAELGVDIDYALDHEFDLGVEG